MHVSLTQQQEEWIQSLIQDGLYASTSDVLRHAIRLLQEEAEIRQVKLRALREAVQNGVDEIEREGFSSKNVQDIIADGKRREA